MFRLGIPGFDYVADVSRRDTLRLLLERVDGMLETLEHDTAHFLRVVPYAEQTRVRRHRVACRRRSESALSAMKRGQDGLEERLDEEEEQVGDEVRLAVHQGIDTALARIAQGRLASPTARYTIS
jgi:hypothetical protein